MNELSNKKQSFLYNVGRVLKFSDSTLSTELYMNYSNTFCTRLGKALFAVNIIAAVTLLYLNVSIITYALSFIVLELVTYFSLLFITFVAPIMNYKEGKYKPAFYVEQKGVDDLEGLIENTLENHYERVKKILAELPSGAVKTSAKSVYKEYKKENKTIPSQFLVYVIEYMKVSKHTEELENEIISYFNRLIKRLEETVVLDYDVLLQELRKENEQNV